MLSLSCSRWDLVPWLGVEPGPPALGARSLSHRTTRKVPYAYFLWVDFSETLQGYLPLPQTGARSTLLDSTENAECIQWRHTPSLNLAMLGQDHLPRLHIRAPSSRWVITQLPALPTWSRRAPDPHRCSKNVTSSLFLVADKRSETTRPLERYGAGSGEPSGCWYFVSDKQGIFRGWPIKMRRLERVLARKPVWVEKGGVPLSTNFWEQETGWEIRQ